VSVAVSGGADSLALLALAAAAGLEVTAFHVDHGIRAGSSSEADLVAAASIQVGAGFRSMSVIVEPGPNLEARARSARYAALPADVLTGHTADDQAETVIINLLRGAALDGLGGIRAIGGPSGRVQHPLLALRRFETEAVCRHLGWVPFRDPSNTDVALLRNRVRHELLPLLADASQRDLVPVLARQAHLAADDSALLDLLAAELDPTDCRALVAAPLPLARRAVRRWLTTTYPPDSAAVERVLEVARGASLACELPGGARVSRTNQRLSVSPPTHHD